MKKFTFGFIISIFLLIGIVANAEEVTTTLPTDTSDVTSPVEEVELPDAGITPESPFYGIDRFFENLSLRLTFSDEKRIEKLSQIAEERLAELNAIDPEKSQEWADKLFDAYGVNLQKANDLAAQLIADGKLPQEKVAKLQERLEKATLREEKVNENIKGHINQELKDRVNEIKVETYLTTMSSVLTKEQYNELRDQNLGNGVIVKLTAFSEISGMSINDILALDIYTEDDPTTEVVEKEIDFAKLEAALGLTQDQIVDQLKEYRETIKTERQAQVEEKKAQQEQQNTNNEAKREEAQQKQEQAQQKREEAQQKRDEMQQKIKDRLESSKNNKGNK